MTTGTEAETDRDWRCAPAWNARHSPCSTTAMSPGSTAIAFDAWRAGSDAEDATSAIFTRALERLDDYRGDTFAAWLFAIARSSLADQHRRKLDLYLFDQLELIDAATRLKMSSRTRPISSLSTRC